MVLFSHPFSDRFNIMVTSTMNSTLAWSHIVGNLTNETMYFPLYNQTTVPIEVCHTALNNLQNSYVHLHYIYGGLFVIYLIVDVLMSFRAKRKRFTRNHLIDCQFGKLQK